MAGALFGGPLPIIATALVGWGGGRPWFFAGYLALIAVISAVAAYLAPETSRARIAARVRPRRRTAMASPSSRRAAEPAPTDLADGRKISCP